MNLTQPGFFRQVFEVYLDLGLSYHQAALVNYIHRWNDTGQQCFAAVETIASDLRLPMRTMRRVIDRSIADNIISGSSSGKGRARVLKVTDAFLQRVRGQLETQVAKVDTSPSETAPEVAKVDTRSGQIVTPSGHFVTASGQSGHLSKLISIPISKTNDLDTPSDDYKTLSVSEEQTMAERKAGQANRDWWSALAQSEKKDLLAQVEAFGTVFDKKLCKPDTDIGLAILRKYATQQLSDVIKQPQDAQG
jgi:hypothetical protein